ncbi:MULTISPECIES: cobalt-precorrin-6A reductase [Thiorhodovibrio]|uniref:cobalt-precorrin-6A reductase n=1 Tax=Thiorhodovibrio TaxID=61593 RepID=UPI001911EDFB|nr:MULTISPECIES: cobalt-precorrin-6A reductase [Thiorhodovibrio]MBK5970698.1 cobalt-precorrin-6A reductase [Thiorhodovibrio winogradskyi]WPL14243.1 Precorrin-6A reductase [Thiorhodovibrio litoralis]
MKANKLPRRVLILGGVTEGYLLAEALVDQTRFHPISSLAGRTEHPRTPVGETRIGGFGGVDGLRAFLRERDIDAVVDATHPFADTMGQHAALACEGAPGNKKTPLLRLERPAWMPQPGDQWYPVADWDQAIAVLKAQGARRVLLALGARELAPFSTLTYTWFLARTVTRPDPMPPFVAAELLVARGPFGLDQELKLLRDHQIDTIVCRNSGGDGAAAKLTAARELGVQVIMRERPPRPPLPTVATVAEALDWLGEM